MSNLIDNHVPDFLLSPRFKFVRHFLLLLTLVCITISIFANQSGELVLTWERFYGWVFYFLLTSVIIYFNLYVLAPRFLIKGRLLKYLASMLVLTSFSLVFIAILQMNVQEVSANYEDGNPYIILNMITSIISFGLLIFGTSALLLFKYWIGYSQRIDELASSTLQSELKFLKKQINPHFLFNMLNNANVLIKRNPKEASKVLFKLEDLLRYQINDSSRERVSLASDIRFLNDYLNLEKIRRDNFQFTLRQEGEVDSIWIQPLLFIPFVENAVKHSFDSEHSSYVHVFFKVDAHRLDFRCENSKPAVAVQQGKVGGIGLANIQRRLGLLYPEHYKLEQREDENLYSVILSITL